MPLLPVELGSFDGTESRIGPGSVLRFTKQDCDDIIDHPETSVYELYPSSLFKFAFS